jgi:hypothetical protein
MAGRSPALMVVILGNSTTSTAFGASCLDCGSRSSMINRIAARLAGRTPAELTFQRVATERSGASDGRNYKRQISRARKDVADTLLRRRRLPGRQTDLSDPDQSIQGEPAADRRGPAARRKSETLPRGRHVEEHPTT